MCGILAILHARAAGNAVASELHEVCTSLQKPMACNVNGTDNKFRHSTCFSIVARTPVVLLHVRLEARSTNVKAMAWLQKWYFDLFSPCSFISKPTADLHLLHYSSVMETGLRIYQANLGLVI